MSGRSGTFDRKSLSQFAEGRFILATMKRQRPTQWKKSVKKRKFVCFFLLLLLLILTSSLGYTRDCSLSTTDEATVSSWSFNKNLSIALIIWTQTTNNLYRSHNKFGKCCCPKCSQPNRQKKVAKTLAQRMWQVKKKRNAHPKTG